MSKGLATKGCASREHSRGQRRQKQKNEVAVTPDSRVVPHPSTKEARRSLTSEFG